MSSAEAPHEPEVPPSNFAELPADILDRVFATLVDVSAKMEEGRGPLADLSAAASVCRAWRCAAYAPHFWTQLVGFRAGRCGGQRLDDAALSAMVSRAAGGLSSLDLSSIEYASVTAGGVISALGGYAGKLRLLKVAGIVCDRLSATESLSAFLASEARPLDVPVGHKIWCTGRPDVAFCRGALCNRLCDAMLCDECRIAACKDCVKKLAKNRFKEYLPHVLHMGNAGEYLDNGTFHLCEHLCHLCCDQHYPVVGGDLMYCTTCYKPYCYEDGCINAINVCMCCTHVTPCQACNPDEKLLFYCFGCNYNYCVGGCVGGSHAPVPGADPAFPWHTLCRACVKDGHNFNNPLYR